MSHCCPSVSVSVSLSLLYVLVSLSGSNNNNNANKKERIREHLRQKFCDSRRTPGNLRRVERGSPDARIGENGITGFHAGCVGVSRGGCPASHLRDALQTDVQRHRNEGQQVRDASHRPNDG